MTPTAPRRQFASDNYAGICPEAFAAMAEANQGHQPGYGDDRWTAEAADLLRETFETDCEVFFAFNGTAANSLALSSLCQSYHSIVCHETAHVETDECGAPEFFSNGTKVLTAGGEHGKLGPDAVEQVVRRRADIHYPKPRVVSVTQPTELGTALHRGRALGLWGPGRGAWACASTWTGRASPTRWRRSTSGRAPSPATWASTSCAWAAPRTGWRWVTR